MPDVFENGVILYGGKTNVWQIYAEEKFENGVILYGGKTQYQAKRD